MLTTASADYDEPGSWGPASEEWPELRDDLGDEAYAMYVFANCVDTIPYGSYVLMSWKGEYGATKTCLRVHPYYLVRLQCDFYDAGSPSPEQSIERREQTGTLNEFGNRQKAPKWW